MTRPAQRATAPLLQTTTPSPQAGERVVNRVQRISSEDLFRQMREIEIDHEGRIYRLRLTQLNKLILTA
jgi:hemin uptake protein HemP